MTEPTPALYVTVEDGKYTVVQEASGKLHALRHGERWRDLTGDNLILALAQELDEARRTLPETAPAEWIEAMMAAIDEGLGDETGAIDLEEIARAAYAALARKMGGRDAE